MSKEYECGTCGATWEAYEEVDAHQKETGHETIYGCVNTKQNTIMEKQLIDHMYDITVPKKEEDDDGARHQNEQDKDDRASRAYEDSRDATAGLNDHFDGR